MSFHRVKRRSERSVPCQREKRHVYYPDPTIQRIGVELWGEASVCRCVYLPSPPLGFSRTAPVTESCLRAPRGALNPAGASGSAIRHRRIDCGVRVYATIYISERCGKRCGRKFRQHCALFIRETEKDAVAMQFFFSAPPSGVRSRQSSVRRSSELCTRIRIGYGCRPGRNGTPSTYFVAADELRERRAWRHKTELPLVTAESLARGEQKEMRNK